MATYLLVTGIIGLCVFLIASLVNLRNYADYEELDKEVSIIAILSLFLPILVPCIGLAFLISLPYSVYKQVQAVAKVIEEEWNKWRDSKHPKDKVSEV